jgi:hypothetical protein
MAQRERRKERSMIALSNSIHLYARPDIKEHVLESFINVLGLEAVASSDAVGSPEPIFSSRCGSSSSVSQ